MRRGPGMLGVVYRKELLDSLRDRRALLSMILVPLVVIPAVMIGFGGLSAQLAQQASVEVHDIVLLGAGEARGVAARLEHHPALRVLPETKDVLSRIADKKVQAAVEFPEGFSERLADGETAQVKIYTYEGEMRSSRAAGRVEGVLHDFRAEVVRDRLAEAGLPPSVLQPFKVARQNVAPPERVTGVLIGGLLPYMLIILCITGAIYPAMDLTAGEKERGTMETLLSSPVPRTSLVLGKFLVVCTFALTTALLSVAALGGTFWFGVSRMQAAGEGMMPFAISLPSMFAVLLLLLPIAALFSALLLTLSLFARTFKEAQTYVSPLILMAILPAIVAVMPGVELTPLLALVPVLNISLISRELLSGIFLWDYLALILVSSTLYAALALWAAVRLFHRESIVFRT